MRDDFAGLRCPECDYDLTGSHDCRCPECGVEFVPEEVRRNQYDGDRRFSDRANGVFFTSVAAFTIQLSIMILEMANYHSSAAFAHPPLSLLIIIPWLAQAVLALPALVIAFMAVSSDAPRSALKAFVACLICAIGTLLHVVRAFHP